jgi:hypothetical protein
MTDRAINRVSFFVALALALALLFLAERSAHSQAVKPALPPQHQVAPHTAPPVRPATACRVCTASGPVTGWESCGKAIRTAQRRTAHGSYAWVERKTGGKP